MKSWLLITFNTYIFLIFLINWIIISVKNIHFAMFFLQIHLFYLLKFSRALPFYTTSLPLSASLFTNLLFCFCFVFLCMISVMSITSQCQLNIMTHRKKKIRKNITHNCINLFLILIFIYLLIFSILKWKEINLHIPVF